MVDLFVFSLYMTLPAIILIEEDGCFPTVGLVAYRLLSIQDAVSGQA